MAIKKDTLDQLLAGRDPPDHLLFPAHSGRCGLRLEPDGGLLRQIAVAPKATAS